MLLAYATRIQQDIYPISSNNNYCEKNVYTDIIKHKK